MRDNTTEDYVLAGDIGGTKTNLGIFVMGKRRPRIKVFKSFPSSEFNGLEEIVALFLSENRYTLKRACFGVAGTVEKGISRITNLPWVINSLKIKDIFNMENVVLINDLSALAYSVPWLTDSELYPLTRVRAEKKGNISLIASGTGLGQALLIHSENGYIPVASEGGHVDFAPNNALEIGLLGFLLERFDHVSIERVISGTGIINIYDFLRSTGKFSEPEWLFKKIKNNMPAKVINESAREKRQKLCLKTIDVFISVLGAAAGNLALTALTKGGVYVGGGIPPKLLWRIKEDDLFMKHFTAKGRFKELMERMPVYIILNNHAALLGAAIRAFRI